MSFSWSANRTSRGLNPSFFLPQGSGGSLQLPVIVLQVALLYPSARNERAASLAIIASEYLHLRLKARILRRVAY